MSPEWMRAYWEDGDTTSLRVRLAEVADDLCASELHVLLFVAERLRMGQRLYGQLNPHDGRDWQREKGEEVADMLVYAACEWLQDWKKPPANVVLPTEPCGMNDCPYEPVETGDE